MLFVLNEELACLVKDGNPDAIRVVNDLCDAVRYGYHSLYAERAVLELLRDSDYLHQESKGIIKHLLSKYAFSYGIRNTIKLNVLLNNGRDIIVNTSPEITQIEVPIVHIKDNSFFQETDLLLENILEEKFYLQMARYYCSKAKIASSARVSIRVLNGGGNSTDTVFRNEIIQKRKCLCICDSDLKYPDDKLGETASGVLGNETKDWPLCKVITTDPFREIENLIPYSKLLYLSKHNGDIRKAIAEYGQILKLDLTFYQYIDIKYGVTIGLWNKMQGKERLFIDNLLVASGLLSDNDLDKLRKMTSKQIEAKSTVHLIKHSGGNTLSLYLEKHSNDAINANDFVGNQESVWLLIGKQVFEWGFSMGRVAV